MTAEVLHLPIGRRHPGAPRGLCHRVVRPPELDRWPAAYAAVLARHSGQREFALATPRGSVAVDCRGSISLAELAAQWATAPAVDLPAVAGVAVREAYPPDAAALWLVVDDESVALDYDTSVWSAESASALLDCCHTLVTADPARPQRDIPIGEVALIDTSGAQLTGPGLDELVREWASRTPDAVAVVCGGREVSYAELDGLVDHQVARLRGCGARRGDRVCVLLDRDLDWVAVELALLRIGAACVPLDREYPRARHELVLDDTAPVLLVTLRRHGLHGSVRTLLMDDVPAPDPAETAPVSRGGEPVERVSEVTAADTAYVFYTSGSTGRPKGVLVPHGSLRNLLAAQRDLLKLGPQDRVLQAFSPSFDLSVWDLGLAFGVGAASVLLDGDDLVGSARRGRVTVISASPSMLAAIDLSDLPGLHTVVTGGEACPAELAGRLAPKFRFVNAYGPTEATVVATTHVISPELPRPYIGGPLPGVTAMVLDSELLPQPAGVLGELYLGGVGVADGYHRRPALTAERFLPDPYADRPGARMYRTGDRARSDADGVVDFLGRVDHQLKVRGLRIEPGEIEAALRRCPGVRHAVVVALGDGPQRRLVGYVEAPDPHAVTAGDLRERLAAELPRYLTPGALVILPRLPLNPNGKVDRAALPAPGSGERPESVGPGTPVEAALARAWHEVLGRGDVGVHDNFFDLGGDSIGATQVVAAMARDGWAITVEALFSAATLGALAATAQPAKPPKPAPATPTVDDETRRKLTAALGGLG